MLNVKAIWDNVGDTARRLAQVGTVAKQASAGGREMGKDANLTALEFGVILWTNGVTDRESYNIVSRYSDWSKMEKHDRQRISERMSRVKAIWRTPEGHAMFAANAKRWVEEGITDDERTALYNLIRAPMTAERLFNMYTRMKYLDTEEAVKFVKLLANDADLRAKSTKAEK